MFSNACIRQPCFLVIKTFDGSSIQSDQHNSSNQIVHFIKSPVTISVEPVPSNLSANHFDDDKSLNLEPSVDTKPALSSNLSDLSSDEEDEIMIEDGQNLTHKKASDSQAPSNADGPAASTARDEHYSGVAYGTTIDQARNSKTKLEPAPISVENKENFRQADSKEHKKPRSKLIQRFKNHKPESDDPRLKEFRIRNVRYYVILKSSGKQVDKDQFKKIVESGYERESSVKYRCKAHAECNYTSPRLTDITNHVFSMYFYIVCSICTNVFRNKNSFYSHFNECQLMNDLASRNRGV